MADEQFSKEAQNALMSGGERHLKRLPDESEQAHCARMVYCRLEPGKRSLAAAYRVIKGKDPAESVKVPGSFGGWARRYRWKEYAAAWDAYHQGLTADPQAEQPTAARQAIVKRTEQLTAARQQTIDQAEQLQALIEQEIDRLKESGRRWHLWLRRLWPGSAKRRSADLADLAAALKDVSAARMAALRGTESDDHVDR